VTIHVLKRGPATRSCEGRRSATGEGYELLITIDGASHIEPFSTLSAMLARERALLSVWRAHGWEEVA
jgi:hypothetical protein